MSDVETLQELMTRRLQEMGRRRGRDALTLREAHESSKDDLGRARVSYETARQIYKGEYTSRLSDDSADGLAAMLDVGVSEILAAAGQRPRLGRFSLPRKADRLSDKERRVVLAVVDAILDASGTQRQEPATTETPERVPAPETELEEAARIGAEIGAANPHPRPPAKRRRRDPKRPA